MATAIFSWRPVVTVASCTSVDIWAVQHYGASQRDPLQHQIPQGDLWRIGKKIAVRTQTADVYVVFSLDDPALTKVCFASARYTSSTGVACTWGSWDS